MAARSTNTTTICQGRDKARIPSQAKFIAYCVEAMPLLDKVNITSERDEGCMELNTPADANDFVAICGEMRFWKREMKVHAV